MNIKPLKRVKKCVKPKLYHFDREPAPKRGFKNPKLQLEMKKELTLAKLKFADCGQSSFDLSRPSLNSLRSFSLAVTFRNKYSYCEVQEVDSHEKTHERVYSDKIRLIQDFYARKKVLSKVKPLSRYLVPDIDYMGFEKQYMKVKTAPKNCQFVKPGALEKIDLSEHKKVIRIEIPHTSNQNSMSIQTDEFFYS